MEIIRSKHNASSMEELERKTLKKINRFNENFNSSNAEISYADYKILNDNMLIKCDHLKIDGEEHKHTVIFDLKEKSVICISGLSTLNIYDLPEYMIN